MARCEIVCAEIGKVGGNALCLLCNAMGRTALPIPDALPINKSL